MTGFVADNGIPPCPQCGSTDTIEQIDVAIMRHQETALPGHGLCRDCLIGWNLNAPGEGGYPIPVKIPGVD